MNNNKDTRERESKVVVITTLFGTTFNHVYPAPKKFDSYCFTNNEKLKDELINKGWKPILTALPISHDPLESALQTKYYKFLQFLKEERFSNFNKYDKILVTDHKLMVEDSHVEKLLSIKNNKIIIRLHPDKPSISVWNEVARSISQERYAHNMPKVIDYINEMLKKGYSEHSCIVATGLAIYDINDKRVLNLCDEIFQDLTKIHTAQCQIVWSLVSQKYNDIIQVIPYNLVNPLQGNPDKYYSPEKPHPNIKRVISYILPHGLVLLYKRLKKLQNT